MAKWPTRTTAVEEARRPPTERSLIASAVNVDYRNLLSWKGYNLGRDEVWQRELWRLYDCIGEFRFGANWIGNAVSRASIGIYDTDESGKVGPRSEDPRVRALETTLLGGPAAQSEQLRLMGIDLTVAGELYVIGRAGRDGEADKWYIASPAELTRWAGGVMYDYGTGVMQLLDDVDMLIRVWTPHPNRLWYADSPARGVMNVLIEIERLTKYIFSQIDSRLVSAGLLPIPTGMDFPSDDGEENPLGAAESLMAKLAEAGQASLKGEGSAAGVLPMIAEFPPEVIGKLGLVNFASELSQQAMSLREEAINRFAYGMDFPPEVIRGTGQTNHWSAWNITDQTIKIHIEPILTRICEAFTKCYLRPALAKIPGIDPGKFTYWYDTSGIITRPNRLTDAVTLYQQKLLSGKAVREAGYFREDEAMPEDEQARIFVQEVILRDPTVFQSPDAREIAGVSKEMLPPDAITPPPPPPIPGNTALPQNAIGMPPNRPAEPPARPAARGVSASAVSSVSLALVAGADLAVRRALELAGGRLMDRTHRFPDTPKHELHTKIRVVDHDHAQRVLGGAWTHIPALSEVLGDVDPRQLAEILDAYTSAVLVSGRVHNPDDLLNTLRKQGLVDG